MNYNIFFRKKNIYMFIFILLIGFLSIIVYRQFNITNNVNRILCLHPYANCTTAKCITSSTKKTFASFTLKQLIFSYILSGRIVEL